MMRSSASKLPLSLNTWLLVLGGGGACFTLFRWFKALCYYPFPGPRGRGPIGPKMQRGTFIHQLELWCKQYGKVRGTHGYHPISFRRWGQLMVLVSDAEDIIQVMKGRPDALIKDPTIRHAFSHLGRDGLWTSEGAEWQRQRKLMSLPFALNNLESMLGIMTEKADVLAAHLDKMGVVEDVRKWVQYCTTDIVCQAAFGKNFNFLDDSATPTHGVHKQKLLLDLLRAHLAEVKYRIVAPWTVWPLRLLSRTMNEYLSHRKRARFKRIDKINDFTREAVLERFNALHKDPSCVRNDLLDQAILACTDPEERGHWKEPGALEIIMANLTTFWIAGSETTANTISWILYFLSTRPYWQNKCREQIHQIRSARSSRLTVQDLENMTFLKAVVLETHRIKPVTPIHYSVVSSPQGFRLKDKIIPEGTRICCMNRFAVTEGSDIYDKLSFCPQRWLEETGDIKTDVEVDPNLVFGSGPRACPGRRMAELEILVIVSTILQRFGRLYLKADDSEMKERLLLTMGPSKLGIDFT